MKKISCFILSAIISSSLCSHAQTENEENTVYDEKNPYYEGLARVKMNKKYGFIDRDNNVVIPIKYDEADDIPMSKMYRVKFNNEWGFVNSKGVEVVNPKYEDIGYLPSGNIFEAKLHGKWGIVDLQGEIIIPFTYEFIHHRTDDELIEAKLKGKWGFINIKNEVIIPLKYDETSGFIWVSRKYAIIKRGKKYGLIDRTGKEIIKPQFEDIVSVGFVGDGILEIIKNKKIHKVNMYDYIEK
jgi:hypothetical protein